MKLLFDQNLSRHLCRLLGDIFPHSEQVRVVGLEHADDRTIWEFARAGGFAVVTLDSDFADLAALRGAPPKVVWLRCGNQSTAETARLLRDRAADIAAFLANEDAACLEVY